MRTKVFPYFAILLCVGLALACTSKTSTENPSLLVAAAANLSEVFPEIGERFTNQTGIKVVFSFGATGDLSKQVEHGAPFDVFAAADTSHVDGLDTKGLITPGSRALYARGRLVMWLPPNGLRAEKIEDITGGGFERIAIPKPDVAPYGQAAVESLQAIGIWDRIAGKVVYGQSVAQAKQFASSGNAEVAFIPLALVKPGEGSYLIVDEKLHRPIDQAIGILRSSPNQEAARKFVDFLLSSEGQTILTNKGYVSAKG